MWIVKPKFYCRLIIQSILVLLFRHTGISIFRYSVILLIEYTVTTIVGYNVIKIYSYSMVYSPANTLGFPLLDDTKAHNECIRTQLTPLYICDKWQMMQSGYMTLAVDD